MLDGVCAQAWSELTVEGVGYWKKEFTESFLDSTTATQ